MSEPYEVSLIVTLRYNHPVEPRKVANWVEDALDHSHDENMLSGDAAVPEEEDLTCDVIRVLLPHVPEDGKMTHITEQLIEQIANHIEYDAKHNLSGPTDLRVLLKRYLLD